MTEPIDITTMMEPYAGRVTKQDVLLSSVLAKLNSLTTLVLKSQYEEGSEELRKAFQSEQQVFAETLKIQLDAVAKAE